MSVPCDNKGASCRGLGTVKLMVQAEYLAHFVNQSHSNLLGAKVFLLSIFLVMSKRLRNREIN